MEMVQKIDEEVVVLELKSNWGHPNLIGLTELMFFNELYQKIAVSPS